MNLMITFKEFIEKKYLEWQNEQGKRKSVAEYAVFLGVSQPLVSMWMNGSKKPGKGNIKALYDIYGEEVIEVLGRNKYAYFIEANVENFNDEELGLLNRLAAMFEERVMKNAGNELNKKRKRKPITW